MSINLKSILICLGALLLIALLVIAGVFWWTIRTADKNAAVIEKLCQIPPGTAVDQILPLARELGIREEGAGSALGKAISIESKDSEVNFDETQDDLPGFTRGKITLGKTVIFPFERHYCEIEVIDRKVTRTNKRILD